HATREAHAAHAGDGGVADALHVEVRGAAPLERDRVHPRGPAAAPNDDCAVRVRRHGAVGEPARLPLGGHAPVDDARVVAVLISSLLGAGRHGRYPRSVWTIEPDG